MPALRQFGARGWAFATLAAAGYAVLAGIPMVMIENPLFRRMTPVRLQDYVFWLGAAALIGLIAGTFAVSGGSVPGRTVSGGVLGYFAIGCPICNKVAVLLLGVSGALSIFGPAQLIMGIASLLLLGWALLLRTEAVAGRSCPA
jgi:hypothetical protein